jgi:glycosyltransferase involved in cell wall biosynthesis
VRVLYVIDSLARSGGAEQSLLAMVPGLVTGGVDLTVAHLMDRPGLSAEIQAAGAAVRAVPEVGRAARVVHLRRLVRATRPDLVHTTLFEADVAGRLAAALAHTPVVSSLVNASYGPEHRKDPALRQWRVRGVQALDAATAQWVRRFHAISTHVAESMATRLRVPLSRIDVIPRGRDPEAIGQRTADRSARARRLLGVPSEAPLVVAAARHERQKGLDVLVDSFSTVAADCPDARLVIAGRIGNATREIEAIVARRGLTDRVQLLGTRSDVAELIGASDVFVAPSRWEGLGSVLIEAMALEAPIVASRIPAIEETVGPGGCAVLVPPEDPTALAAAILSTLADPNEARARGRRARERFLAQYSIDHVTRQMLAFYRLAIATTR